MANTLAPRGLINPRLKTGGEPRTQTLLAGVTYASDFLPGQIVIRRADGRIIHCATTAYKTVLGVVQSYLKNPNAQGSNPDVEVQVVTDLINTEWELQLSTGAHATAGQYFVGESVGILAAAYLNKADTARRFAPYMVGGTPDTTSRMLRVIGLVVDQKNEPDSANPRVRVEFNSPWLENFSTRNTSPGV
jgi:hypothetical protein